MIKDEFGDRVVLAFSRGKDAIGCWLALRDDGFEVLPYHNVLIPGLVFVEESLLYFERKLGTHIRRIPHPTLYDFLNEGLFQTPATDQVIRAAKLPNFTSEMTEQIIAVEEGLPAGAMAAVGIRAFDNLTRRVMIIQNGPILRKRRRFFPVWDWTKAQLLGEIEKAGIKLPIDYEVFGRSFDGISLKHVYQIKYRFPDDYRTLLEWFPLVEVEVWRYERYGHEADA